MLWLWGPNILIFDYYVDCPVLSWEGNIETGPLGTLIKYPWHRLCRSLFRSTSQSIKDQPMDHPIISQFQLINLPPY